MNAKTWTQLVGELASDAEPNGAEDISSVVDAEKAVSSMFPKQLREFLLEYGPLTANYKTSLVWPASEIAARNTDFRSDEAFQDLYMPFDNLLFFGDNGDGNQFAYAIQANGKIRMPDIYMWEHETDARIWFASGLHQFLGKVLDLDA